MPNERRRFSDQKDYFKRDGGNGDRRQEGSRTKRYGLKTVEGSSFRRRSAERTHEREEFASNGRKRFTPKGDNGYSRADNSPKREDYTRTNRTGYSAPKNNMQRRDARDDYNRKPQASLYSKKKQLEYKKSYVDFDAPMRLNKFVANSGVCSRREADAYILAGVITVNGEVVTELGTKIVPSKDRVLFHDQLLRSERKVYVLLNKPKDCVTTTDDPHARMTVMDIVKGACSERIYPVGRLDRNTTGVLLLTNDGELSTMLTHPKYNKKKVYLVTLNKPITPEDMQKLQDGIVLDDGEIHTDAISYVNDDARQVGVEIHSGRNRIVRRMFEYIGYTVKQLDRSMFAGLTKKNLPRGKWRFLSEKEIAILKMGNFE